MIYSEAIRFLYDLQLFGTKPGLENTFRLAELAGNPRLILLDEPLAALDVAHVLQVSELLREIVERTGATVAFASHDLNWAAAFSDRMLVMQAGALAVDATPAEVMQPDVIARYFDLRADVIDGWLVPRRRRGGNDTENRGA